MMRTAACFILGATFFGLAAVGRGGDWPSFRGPGGSGLTTESNLPAAWSADTNVAWKVAIPGRGWSSPIVWKDRVFLTTADSEQDRTARAGGGGPRGGFGPPGGFGGRGGFGGGRPPDVPYKFEVYCLDLATGKVLWKQLALEGKPRIPTQPSNTYATETPATDGERVYAYFGMHGLFCYDLDGHLLWKKDLGAYATQMGQGTASSPAADAGRVFVQVDNEERSFLVALDGQTGRELWRADRDEGTTFASPIVWKNKVRTELVTVGGQKARSYDPATGKVLWELSLGGGQCTASPVAADERVYVGVGGRGGPGGGGFGGFGGGGFGGPGRFGGPPQPGQIMPPPLQDMLNLTAEQKKQLEELQKDADGELGKILTDEQAKRLKDMRAGFGRGGFGGFGGGRGGPGGPGGGAAVLFAVKAGASGDVTPKTGEAVSGGVVWSRPRAAPAMASPLVYQGYVYVLEQNGGMVSCYDAKSGKPAYQRERIPGARSFWASPWAYDGKVFCLDDAGTTHVLLAGPSFKVLGKNALGDTTWATPAPAGGTLVIRGVNGVYGIKP
jgi:outer membrane protein assembly factor BamB